MNDSGHQYRAEAERLAALPAADRTEVIAMHRAVAADPNVPKAERLAASERAIALERHLRRLTRRGNKKPKR